MMKTKQIAKKQINKSDNHNKCKSNFQKNKIKKQNKINQDANKENIHTNIQEPSINEKEQYSLKNNSQFFRETQDSQLQPYLHEIYDYIFQLDAYSLMEISKGSHRFPMGEVTEEMRKVLLKWLLTLATTLKLKSQTLHTCVYLIDRILRQRPNKINKANFQLLGIASLFIATKMVEIFKVEVNIFLAACEGFYSLAELFNMETLIVLVTKFDLNKPSIHEFLFLESSQLKSQKTKFIMKALADLCIYDYELINFYSKPLLVKAITYLSSMVQNQLSEKHPSPQFEKCLVKLIDLYQKSGLVGSFSGKPN